MSNALTKARRDYTDAIKADKPQRELNTKRKKLNIEILKIKTRKRGGQVMTEGYD
jgi:hypothetical protein